MDFPGYGAAEAELNFYRWTNQILTILGWQIRYEKKTFNGLSLPHGPKIFVDPHFALTFEQFATKMRQSLHVKIPTDQNLIILDNIDF